jgi:hypothetical protein
VLPREHLQKLKFLVKIDQKEYNLIELKAIE